MDFNELFNESSSNNENFDWFDEDLILEGKRDVKVYKSKTTNMIAHMLKYKYCNDYQDEKSWPDTIMDGSNTLNAALNSKDASVRNRAKNINLEDIFEDSMQNANNELAEYKNTIDTSLTLDQIKDEDIDWSNIYDLGNPDKMANWIVKNYDKSRDHKHKGVWVPKNNQEDSSNSKKRGRK